MKIFVTYILFVLSVLILSGDCAAAQQNRPDADGMIARWKKMDANSDGQIGRDEAAGLMKTYFDRVDTNSDGTLDRAELTALARRLQNRQAANRPKQNARGNQSLQNVPKDVKVVPDIAYREGDSSAWRLDLVMPIERGDATRPGIVFIHGGGWRGGDKRAGNFFGGAVEYARKGYVCITINYRLLGEAPFPACIEDCKCAVRWFRANAEKYNLDPNRIGAYGNSAGAHLVALLGLTDKVEDLEGDGPYQDQSSAFQAVCCSATPTDFMLFSNRFGDKEALAARYGGTVETVLERVKHFSPITHVTKDAPPMLVIHGTADTTVNVKHADNLVAALEKAGAKDVTYIKVEGANHGVFGSGNTREAMAKFFDRTIGTHEK